MLVGNGRLSHPPRRSFRDDRVSSAAGFPPGEHGRSLLRHGGCHLPTRTAVPAPVSIFESQFRALHSIVMMGTSCQRR
eukprot:2210162-Rhodomonas_salina.1